MTTEARRGKVLRAEVGAALLVRMAERGLSREKFAEKAGVSFDYLQRVLLGEAALRLKMIVRLALALDCVFRIHLSPDSPTAPPITTKPTKKPGAR